MLVKVVERLAVAMVEAGEPDPDRYFPSVQSSSDKQI